jgi:hypothetical protein
MERLFNTGAFGLRRFFRRFCFWSPTEMSERKNKSGGKTPQSKLFLELKV